MYVNTRNTTDFIFWSSKHLELMAVRLTVIQCLSPSLSLSFFLSQQRATKRRYFILAYFYQILSECAVSKSNVYTICMYMILLSHYIFPKDQKASILPAYHIQQQFSHADIFPEAIVKYKNSTSPFNKTQLKVHERLSKERQQNPYLRIGLWDFHLYKG